MLNADEARALLDAIDTGTLTGLRDRALIGVMVYSFARVNAVISMKVKDYFTQGRRGWVRLHEKGGKEHEVPCHHSLEKILDDYIAAAGIAGDPNGPLFRSTGRKTGEPQALWQQGTFDELMQRATGAGIPVRKTDHGFCVSMYLSSPDGLRLEFTVDAPDAEKIAAMRRKDAHSELARWMAGDRRTNNDDRPH